MNEVLKVLKERRSIRAFRPEPLKKEDLDAIVEAGLYAPSAKNLQSTKLVVVRDAAVLARLERLNSRILGTPEGTPFYGAPEAIVVLSDSEYPNWLQDGSLVMGNLMNAAAALGVGSCWINRAMETFELPEGKALLAEWGLGENWKGVGNCILGYTDHRPDAAAQRGKRARAAHRGGDDRGHQNAPHPGRAGHRHLRGLLHVRAGQGH